MKVFLSYSSLDKELAGQIKHELENYGLSVFLAHEDIEPLAEWVDTIHAELKASDIFIPILTESFSESDWTDQETGIAFALNKLIISLKITEDPHGFIARFQALKMDMKEIKPLCYKLTEVIANKPVLGDLFRDTLIKNFGESWSFDNASRNTEILVSFEGYNLRQVTDIIRYTIANNQINKSFKAQGKLNNLIHKYKDSIDPELLQAFYKAIE
jgi:hypothetical protein